MEKNILLEIPAVVARQVVYFVIPFFFFRCCCCTLAQLHDAINLKWGRESTVGRKNFDTSRSKVSNIFCSMIDWNNFSALHYTAEFRICISHVSLMNFVFTLLSETCWWSSLFFLHAYSYKAMQCIPINLLSLPTDRPT